MPAGRQTMSTNIEQLTTVLARFGQCGDYEALWKCLLQVYLCCNILSLFIARQRGTTFYRGSGTIPVLSATVYSTQMQNRCSAHIACTEQTSLPWSTTLKALNTRLCINLSKGRCFRKVNFESPLKKRVFSYSMARSC